MAIGSSRLRQFRQDRELSQEALARLIGVSVRTVVRWEQGHSEPSALAAQRIEELLGDPGATGRELRHG
jgi:transcriptional regulator with XRE-family HTH domain